MPDAVESSDIEDVLSSIRRLVSNDAGRSTPPLHDPMPTKLLLTPALRVPPAPPESEAPFAFVTEGSSEGTAPGAELERVVTQEALTLTLSDRIAELEAAVAQSAEEFEVDEDADVAALQQIRLPRGGDVDAVADARAVSGGVSPQPLIADPDLLRDMMRDMIREELQGTFGERITRNVRKLVRTEINRALAARELR